MCPLIWFYANKTMVTLL